MTNRICTFLILLTLSFGAAAQTVTKTFTKAFNTDGKSVATLNLPGTIDLRTWDGPSVRLEITVSLPSGNGSMLNELANIGRYNLVAKSEGDALVITAPNLQKQIKVKGEELREVLHFVVFAPKNMKVEAPTLGALADIKK
jgi:hypothetical protein